ncbi:uncharacterized protein LOC143558493 [Bidens hawaiensis]|uniref:uncharacterized protein LOC143558493 n=1 Tax=Bidens hawaiensis TaxID=980011 RepID=UPI004049CAC0
MWIAFTLLRFVTNRVGQRIVLLASFIGGPRDMRRQFLDAMTLVQDDGKPDLFLTMTCNPQWPEICDNLKPGQTAQDRPDLVSRVFRAKLEDLKEPLLKKHLLGEVKAYVYVIEFQKRGLPHAHFLLIMYPQDKINNPDHYDKVVCAEIPDMRRHPKMHDLVVKHMMHGPTFFEDLCTVNGVKYPTFRRAALEIGLIENDDCLSQCLIEASLFQFPNALRGLFATILIFCKPGDVRKLWNDHFDSLSEDYWLHCENIHQVQDMVLADIRGFLQSMGTNINQFDLPKTTEDVNLQYAMHREVQDEYMIVVEPEHLSTRDSLNFDQKIVYDEIMTHVDNDRPGLFFIDGPGGTGKTFVYKALLAQVRSRGIIALATASSGAATNNMPGGRTAHSRFKIPINLNNNSMCKINHQSGTVELIRLAKLIIWDEASMAKRQAIEAVDRTLQDIIGVRLPFGGKIMVMGGDFRQVLPVVKCGTRAQIVDSSFRMSPLWSVTKKMRLP